MGHHILSLKIVTKQMFKELTRLLNRIYAALDGRFGIQTSSLRKIMNMSFLLSGLVSFSNKYRKNRHASSTMHALITLSTVALTTVMWI